MEHSYGAIGGTTTCINTKLRHNKGYTIIELMIVVAIVGILSSIGFASYTEQVKKARRTTATDDTLSCAAILERRFTLTNSYSVDTPSVHCDVISDDNPDYTIVVIPDDEIDINGTDKFNSFVITTTASSNAMLGDDQCRKFTYNEQGVKQAYKSDSTTLNTATCWRD